MASIDPLLRRKEDFAAGSAHEAVSIVAKHPGLHDHLPGSPNRPSAFLELGLGDAMVIRNAGGRVSPDRVKDPAYICYLSDTLVPGGAAVRGRGRELHPVGTHFLVDQTFRRGFAELIGGDDAALAAEAVVDPEQSVRFDVELLRSATVLPDTITVSGHFTTSPPFSSARSSPPRLCTPARPP